MVFWNKTKIVATVGPACSSKTGLLALISAGADVMRINGAHGSIEEHRETIRNIKAASLEKGLPIAILYDLPGPKIRLGQLAAEPVNLKRGQHVVLSCGMARQRGGMLPVPARFVAKAVKKGSRIFISDGVVALEVVSVEGKNVYCDVIAGGEIRSRKGINLPRVRLPIPSLTSDDRKLLRFALREGVDYIGLSFVRSHKDVAMLKRLIGRKRAHVGVVAKIEKPEALDDIDRIIKEADAVMVARGDLGIEMPFDQIPMIQRRLLRKCLEAGRPSITATQMMESMVESSRPTRAESVDVAIAVWEGTDAVMLSEETSIGKNPSKAVSAMARIARNAEEDMSSVGLPRSKSSPSELQAQVIGRAACMMADELAAYAIVAPTRSGRTPLFISGMRPKTQVIALTEDAAVSRRMCLYWGVRPIKMGKFRTVDEMLSRAESLALKSRYIKRGDTIVITSGAHGKKDDITRLVEVRKV
jgi:pyruvate kinase